MSEIYSMLIQLLIFLVKFKFENHLDDLNDKVFIVIP